MVMKIRTYPKTYSSQTLGRVMAVDQNEADFKDEEAEFHPRCTLSRRSREVSAKIMMSHPFTSTMQTANLKMLFTERLAHAA